MESILDVLASLDVINQVDRLIGNIRHGPHHRFYISRLTDWAGWDIECFLGRYGVRIWGRGLSPDYISFNVKQRQTDWAEYLLLRRGIPVASRPINEKNQSYAEKHAPGSEPPGWRRHSKPSQRKQSRLDELIAFLLGKPPVRK